MSRLNWDEYGKRYYEVGVDRGVLFVDANNGVPWNGLVSVTESPSGGENNSFYADGVKFINLISAEEFGATIEAFTYPDEFTECDGLEGIQGLYLGQQRRKSFGLSYRTRVGNDVDGANHAYKIHLVYNAIASPSERTNTSISESPETATFSWNITTTPVPITGHKPTSHFVIDSRDMSPEVLTLVENIIYGSPTSSARFPTPDELIAICDIPYVDPQFTGPPLDGGFPDSTYTSSYDGEFPSSTTTSTVEGGHA